MHYCTKKKMNKNEGSTVFELLMLNFTNSKQLKNKCLAKFYTSEKVFHSFHQI